MTTREQWQKMTRQQQWDYVSLLESMIEARQQFLDGEISLNEARVKLGMTPIAEVIPFDDDKPTVKLRGFKGAFQLGQPS